MASPTLLSGKSRDSPEGEYTRARRTPLLSVVTTTFDTRALFLNVRVSVLTPVGLVTVSIEESSAALTLDIGLGEVSGTGEVVALFVVVVSVTTLLLVFELSVELEQAAPNKAILNILINTANRLITFLLLKAGNELKS
jgi:hypothetical protein